MSQKFYKNGLKFRCTGCGGCCRLSDGKVQLSEEEARNISKFLKMNVDQFLQKFAVEEDGIVKLRDCPKGNCIFLSENACTVYDVRPLQCKTFPFWPENLKSQYRWHQIKNFCPGIDQEVCFSGLEIYRICHTQKEYEKQLKQIQVIHLLTLDD